jgi:hypothetical protein
LAGRPLYLVSDAEGYVPQWLLSRAEVERAGVLYAVSLPEEGD